MENTNKFITKYFTFSFLEGLDFLSPYVAVMFNDYGLSAKQISLVFIMMNIIQLIFEIPTGALADRFGRKKVLLLGNAILIASRFILLGGKNLNTFLIVSALSGIYLSLRSGTYMSLIYDNMKALDIENQSNKLRGRSWSFRLIGISISAFLASYLVKFGYNYLIITSIIANLFYSFSITLFKETYGKNSDNIKKLNSNYWKILKDSFKYLSKHTTIIKFMLFWVLSTSLLKGVIFKFRELFLFEITGKKELVGILASILMISDAFSRWFLADIISKRKTLKVMGILTLGVFLGLMSFIYYSFPISYLLIIGSMSLHCMCATIVYNSYQKFLPSRWRSTIISIDSFFGNIISVLYLLTFGFLADKFTYKNGFIIIGGYQLLLVSIFLIILGFDKHLKKKES